MLLAIKNAFYTRFYCISIHDSIAFRLNSFAIKHNFRGPGGHDRVFVSMVAAPLPYLLTLSIWIQITIHPLATARAIVI